MISSNGIILSFHWISREPLEVGKGGRFTERATEKGLQTIKLMLMSDLSPDLSERALLWFPFASPGEKCAGD